MLLVIWTAGCAEPPTAAVDSAKGRLVIEPDDVPEEQAMMWDGDLAGVATSIAQTRSLLNG